MGLKREHKENIEAIRKEQDVALFNLRGEQAVLIEHYVETINALEAELIEKKKSDVAKAADKSDPHDLAPPKSPAAATTLSEIADVTKVVEGRVSEVVKKEVPEEPFVEYVTKPVHKGIQVNTMTPTCEGEGGEPTGMNVVGSMTISPHTTSVRTTEMRVWTGETPRACN